MAPRFLVFFPVVFLALFCAGCTGNKQDAAANKAADKAFSVDVAHPSYEEVSHTLEAVGSFLPEDEMTVGAEVDGTIKKLFVDEGTIVQKDQPLLEIDDEKFRLAVEETEAQLRESQARLANSKSTLTRMSKLMHDGVVDQQRFDDAKTQVVLHQAAVEKLQAMLNQAQKSLRDTYVATPMEGIVSDRMVAVGEYVKVGAALVKVVDSNPLKLAFSLPEKDAGLLRSGQKVLISTRVYPGAAFEGSIYFINPKVDTATRTIEVKAWVDNSEYKLRPGFFVDVTVILNKRQALVLPESAVTVREGRVIVMAVENDKIVYRRVTPGVRFDGKVEVLDGVSTGDTVVIYGRSEITEGTSVKVTAAQSQ
jgi:membrane fusion protein (multidrug efflux system)